VPSLSVVTHLLPDITLKEQIVFRVMYETVSVPLIVPLPSASSLDEVKSATQGCSLYATFFEKVLVMCNIISKFATCF
jgi:hypothetical protein